MAPELTMDAVLRFLQSRPTLCDSMDCNLLGSSVHGILQAGMLKWFSCPSLGAPPDSGIEPMSLTSPVLGGGGALPLTQLSLLINAKITTY